MIIYRFVLGHVDSIRVASVRICCHLRKRGEPIGLAEVGDVSQGSLELPDFRFSLPIRLVMAGHSHDVFDPHCLNCLFPELRGESWVRITDGRGRYSMRRKIWCRSRSVVCNAVAVTDVGISQLNPTALSTTTRTESWPFVLVKGPIKSIA